MNHLLIDLSYNEDEADEQFMAPITEVTMVNDGGDRIEICSNNSCTRIDVSDLHTFTITIGDDKTEICMLDGWSDEYKTSTIMRRVYGVLYEASQR
ncbi:MAG: hypothetical protein GY861_05675 [bacterium]|nr:hypothetical protein [bacterium]